MYSYCVFYIKMSRIYFVTFIACIVQGAFSQAILPNNVFNNGFNGLAANAMAANNLANGFANNLATNAIANNLANVAYPGNTIGGYPLNGNVIAGNAIAATTNAAIANAAVGNIAAQNANLAFESGPISTALPLSGVSPIGFGDVAVAGEMPVGGSTAVSGNVPVIGFVTFEGYLPAGGMVSVASNCACNGETPIPNV
ncbi:chorion class A protein Ld19-like [Maniola jurtina]|uniref:chorion class A protein Ld19-like n=1 Tax=Maniola jurtina TaxID=191418 RepID=UPI001E6891DA|nr:chorion class A protein Ld19-like [Maniola jurtina]